MKYKFVGDGTGVPGLPHMISEDEAAASGISELLKAAIENGNYQPAGDDAVSTETDGESGPRRSARKNKES